MTRIRTMLVILGVVGACVGVLGVTQAAAATEWQWEECLEKPPEPTPGQYSDATCDTPGTAGWYWEPVEIIGPIEVTDAATSISLEATLAGVEFQIKCSTQSGEGEGEEGAGVTRMSGLTLSLEGCTVTKPAGNVCSVPSTIATNSLKAESVSGAMSATYAPSSGTTLLTATVSGASCPVALKGSKSLTGTAKATVNETAGVEEFTATSGSSLKFGGQAATLLDDFKLCTPGNERRDRIATH